MSSAAASLLEQARATLAGSGAHSHRVACWVARAALEACVDDLLAARKCAAPRATMRSRLTILEASCADDEPILAARAEYAWAGLSQVCHHHAFELSPTASEVTHFLDVVGRLIHHDSAEIKDTDGEA